MVERIELGKSQGEDSDARDKFIDNIKQIDIPHLYEYRFHDKNTVTDNHKSILLKNSQKL